MEYLWLGMCLADEHRTEIIENRGSILSASISQDSILAGLEENGLIFETINTYSLPSFPSYKKFLIRPRFWKRHNNSENQSVGFINLPYISHISKSIALLNTSKRWNTLHIKKEVIIFVYSMHFPLLNAAISIKKANPNAKLLLIVPDLPQYMDLSMSFIKKIFKKIDWFRIQKRLEFVDHFFLYSNPMAEFLKISNTKWSLFEGSLNKSDLIPLKKNNKVHNKIVVMYSGALNERFGIRKLLDAFVEINNAEFELWFTGSGEATNLINEYSFKDRRIKLLGFLPSRKDLLQKQQECTMLINLRDPEESASSYCFPSKLFEYMVSGNPVITSKIKGIPDEYYNYLFAIENFSSNGIKDAILRVAGISQAERDDFGIKARNFIIENKNNVEQTKRIIKITEKSNE